MRDKKNKNKRKDFRSDKREGCNIYVEEEEEEEEREHWQQPPYGHKRRKASSLNFPLLGVAWEK